MLFINHQHFLMLKERITDDTHFYNLFFKIASDCGGDEERETTGLVVSWV